MYTQEQAEDLYRQVCYKTLKAYAWNINWNEKEGTQAVLLEMDVDQAKLASKIFAEMQRTNQEAFCKVLSRIINDRCSKKYPSFRAAEHIYRWEGVMSKEETGLKIGYASDDSCHLLIGG